MKINLQTQCPHCLNTVEVEGDIERDMLNTVNRSRIKPAYSVDVFRINSEDIKQFITQKARMYVPDVKVEVVTKYTESRRRKGQPASSFAYLQIALSQEAIESGDKYKYFDEMMNIPENTKVVNSLFHNIIQKYRYSKDEIASFGKDYASIEFLESSFGINEKFLQGMYEYSTIRQIKDQNNFNWIIVAASADRVIEDMLTPMDSDKLDSDVRVMSTKQLSKDICEFVIHLRPKSSTFVTNDNIKEILTGGRK